MPKFIDRMRNATQRFAGWIDGAFAWVGRQLHISSKFAAGGGFLIVWGIGMTFIQVDEYAVAIICWVGSSVVLISKAIHWPECQVGPSRQG
jgi:hypothetical protein